MRAAVVSLLLLMSFAPAAVAQTPDFSGRWGAISPGYEGRELRLTRSRATLTVTHNLNRRNETVVYNLDGTPRRTRLSPDEEQWTTAAWNNGTLTLAETRLTRTTEQRTEQTLSFDTSRRLIVGINRSRRNTSADPATPSPPPQSKTVIVLKKRPG